MAWLICSWTDTIKPSLVKISLLLFEPRHDKTCLREFPTRHDTNRPAQPQKLARVFILSKQRLTKALIRLRGCVVWSAPLLSAYDIKRIFSWPGSIRIYFTFLCDRSTHGQIRQFWKGIFFIVNALKNLKLDNKNAVSKTKTSKDSFFYFAYLTAVAKQNLIRNPGCMWDLLPDASTSV